MQTERQKEILEVAIDIIAKKGIQGLTIKNLSKAIGISEPAIYRHFNSKTEILMTILENFKEMAMALSEMLVEMDMPAIEKINFMFGKMIDLFEDSPSMVSVIFSEEIFKNDETLKNKIVEILNLHSNTVENIITEGQKSGNVRNDINAGNLTLIIIGALRFLVKKWDLNNYSFNLNKEGENLVVELDKILKNRIKR